MFRSLLRPTPKQSRSMFYGDTFIFARQNRFFDDLIEELLPNATKARREGDKDKTRDTLRIILTNLLLGFASWECIAIPADPIRSSAGYLAKKNNVSRKRLESCIDALSGGKDYRDDPSTGWMYQVQKGYVDNTSVNKASTYFPTQKFIDHFESALYCQLEDFDELTDERLIKFNSFIAEEQPSYDSLANQLGILRTYNDFMRDQRWAMKNPSSLTYSRVFPRGGRVTNYYQSIVNRRVNLREQTTINHNPIAEPDFTANHLWMFSYLVGEELPIDPYTEIERTTGCSRIQVKTVCTALLGSTHRQQRGGLIKQAPNRSIACSVDEFKRIESALLTTYPWLDTYNCFYADRGSWLQNLEGRIALKMMEWSTDRKMPLLSVHDAFAVEAHNEKETYKAMHEFRLDVLNEARLNDYLEIASDVSKVVVDRVKEEKAEKRLEREQLRQLKRESANSQIEDHDDTELDDYDFDLEEAL